MMSFSGYIRKLRKKKEMLRFYSQFISSGDLCFDIGANIGERTELFLKLGAKVVCVEPQEKCLEILRKKFGSNKNVTILPIVLGSKQTEAELMICNETDECSTMSSEFVSVYADISKFHWHKKQQVQMNTLENLCKDYGIPKLCKIDVEGYESEVFKGLNTPIENIHFEFNRPLLKDTERSLQMLSLIGNYNCNYIEYERMNLVMNSWMPMTEFSNKLFEIIEPGVLTGEIVVKINK